MYTPLLILHSWLRWLALAGVFIAFARAMRGRFAGAPWTPADIKWTKGAAHAMTAQAVVGILLYVVSPYIKQLMQDMGAAMQDRTSRLFAVEHGVVMLLALGLVHMGAALARKSADDKSKHTRVVIFFGIAIFLMGYAIPWMRPLFRLS